MAESASRFEHDASPSLSLRAISCKTCKTSPIVNDGIRSPAISLSLRVGEPKRTCLAVFFTRYCI